MNKFVIPRNDVAMRLVSALFLFISTLHVAAQKQGQARIDSLLGALPAMTDDTNKVNALNVICYTYHRINPDEGLRYGANGLQLAQQLAYEKGVAALYNSIGFNYLSKSDYTTAIHNFNKGLALYQELGLKKGIAKSLLNIGNAYSGEANYPQALNYYLQSLKYAEELGDRNGISATSSNIGTIYYNEGDDVKALAYYNRSLKIDEELGDRMGIASTLVNMGALYQHRHANSQAIKCFTRSMQLCRLLGDKMGESQNLTNLGNVYQSEGQLAKALDHYRQSLAISRQLGNDDGLEISLENIGSTYLLLAADSNRTELKRTPLLNKAQALLLSKIYTDSAIAVSAAIGNVHSLVYCYDLLARIYERLGDDRGALDASRKYYLLNDSLFSVENKMKIEHLTTQRELDLKNKQIEIDKLEVEKKRDREFFFMAGLAGLLLIVMIMYRNYDNQRRSNRALSKLNDTIAETNDQLALKNEELTYALQHLKATQQQLIESEKQKENEMLRTRISQDIHDDISSGLTKISWLSELVKSKAGIQDGNAAAHLDKITASSRETIAKLGEIIWAINPGQDNLQSLLAYIRNHFTRFLEDTPYTYSLDFPDEIPPVNINPELKRNIFLVLKEALNNAVKYAGAGHISLTCKIENNRYQFSLTDDGKGMEPGIVKGSGNGMQNMRKRAEKVNAELIIASVAGAGTQVLLKGELYV